ncbi:MAG: hypothetical protein IT330_03200, partial [Anaerolineae bacterium]|nr:hypothetical protein [Anaerolineae bacterium]
PVDAYFDWFRVSPDVSPTFTPTASLEPVTTTVSAGEVFTLELRISVGNQPIDNVDASVQFSSTHLAVVDASGTETTTVVPGSTLPDILLNEVNNATGRIRYSAGKLTGSPPTGEFLLAHIPFRAKAQTSPQGVRVTCDGTDAFFQGNSVLQQCEGAIVIVTQQCITPGSPALISPSDNITTTNNTPTLDWTDTSNANEYQLQVDNIGDFSSPEIDIRTAASNYTPPSALSDGKYYWRVRGHNTGGGCDIYGSWSGIWSVRIGTVWNTYDDYGSTQGTRNWYYQYWDGTTHRDMVWGTNAYNLTSWYAPDDRWTLQNQAALRPSRYDAERVWMSPVTGQIRIVGRFGRYTTRGDGQQVSIWKGATQLWTRTLPDLSSAVFDLTTGIAVGDRIYFRANKRGDDLYDDVDIRATITIVPPQANVPSIALAPSTTAVGVGQVFTLAITIDCGTTSIDGAQAFLNFDPNYLVVVDSSGITATTIITGSAFNTHLINTADNALGRIDYVDGQLTGAPLTGTFTLATVRFKAKQATASTATTFSFALPRQTRLTLGGNNVLNSHTNATVTINAGVLLPGRVNLQGRATPPAPAWSIPITVQLFAPASPVARYVFPTTTSQSGYFDIGPVVGGTYSVTVKNRHTLSVIRRNVSLVADMPRVDFCTLTEGDANNDDAVDITDFSVLRTCFFKPGSQLSAFQFTELVRVRHLAAHLM